MTDVTNAPTIVFAPPCRDLLERTGLAESDVIDAFQNRDDAMIVPAVPTHFYSFRWLDDGRLMFVSSQFTRMEWHVDRARPAETTINLAMRLRRDLPAGPISPEMKPDQLWLKIADSFGTPVTCHKDFPRCLRYTGRWDGKPPRWDETPEGGDRYYLDGVLESSGDNAKYVWVLALKKYLDWLPEPFGGIAAAPAAEDVDPASTGRLVFSRMQPKRLKRPLIVRADIGEAAVRFICTRCSLSEIDDPPYFHPKMKCLHLFGAELLDPDVIPKQASGKEYLVPVHFITDLRPGPEILISGDQAAPRSAVLTNDYKAGNRLSLKSIESLLDEWTAADQPS